MSNLERLRENLAEFEGRANNLSSFSNSSILMYLVSIALAAEADLADIRHEYNAHLEEYHGVKITYTESPAAMVEAHEALMNSPVPTENRHGVDEKGNVF